MSKCGCAIKESLTEKCDKKELTVQDIKIGDKIKVVKNNNYGSVFGDSGKVLAINSNGNVTYYSKLYNNQQYHARITDIEIVIPKKLCAYTDEDGQVLFYEQNAKVCEKLKRKPEADIELD